MDIAKECITAIEDLIEKAHLKKGDIVVVGCSTSEVLGSKIGTNASPDTAKILFERILGENGNSNQKRIRDVSAYGRRNFPRRDRKLDVRHVPITCGRV